MTDVMPDGMCTVWTVERPDDAEGVFIDDLVDTEEEALDIIATKPDWHIWATVKLVVPYKMGQPSCQVS